MKEEAPMEEEKEEDSVPDDSLQNQSKLEKNTTWRFKRPAAEARA